MVPIYLTIYCKRARNLSKSLPMYRIYFIFTMFVQVSLRAHIELQPVVL